MADLFSGDLAVSPFVFGTHSVRVVMRGEQPWFVASDVCAALGYANTSKAVADHLDEDERSNEQLDRSRMGSRSVIISESGLYALVLRSRKPEARKFAKWVTAEVLPTIRKTGAYHHGEARPAFNPLDSAAMAAARGAAMSYFDAFRQSVKDGKPGARMSDLPAQVLEGIIAEALINQRMLVGFDHGTGRMYSILVPRDASVVSLDSDDYVGMVERVPMARLPELADAVNQRVGMHLKAFSKRLSDSNLTNSLPQR